MKKIDIDKYCNLITEIIINAAKSSLKKKQPRKLKKRYNGNGLIMIARNYIKKFVY